jgi:hypothetical protein
MSIQIKLFTFHLLFACIFFLTEKDRSFIGENWTVTSWQIYHYSYLEYCSVLIHCCNVILFPPLFFFIYKRNCVSLLIYTNQYFNIKYLIHRMQLRKYKIGNCFVCFFVFLAHLAMWGIAITWRPSSVR